MFSGTVRMEKLYEPNCMSDLRMAVLTAFLPQSQAFESYLRPVAKRVITPK